MIRTRATHKFWTMWDSWPWGTRTAGTPGCWDDRGGAGFFADAASGAQCGINWLEGYEEGQYTTDAPALMGHDPAYK